VSVETDLYTTLSAASGVTTLVSTRLYVGYAPENATLPYVVYSLVGTDRLATLPSVGDPARKRMQIECVGTTYASAETVAAAVITALTQNGYQQSAYSLYDDITQRHSFLVDWSFIVD
jgi:hypothetical protein